MTNLEPIAALLKADATVFYSDYGSKAEDLLIGASHLPRLRR